ncbi:glycosyltransferase family 2 protein [Sporosarcina trichiuri]|uniref:glycosyltransferase family 2 protein n=1 Tax=Sporosarcina trichiuri TaxID=3056445 RepID=UPI0025B5761F|nr:glycosyltransferase [Sporosarcina sp. 0.2-SM1T-5]WJY28074.1 glycosyltransferase [Sporosarcina sp. 0.2-SM1T-5]
MILLMITLGFYSCFLLFHLLYTFIPLYTSRRSEANLPTEQKGMSIVIPAFNEQAVIGHCLDGILRVDYGNSEVIFVDDGSADGTFSILDARLKLQPTSKQRTGHLTSERITGIFQSELYPHIWVIDKENGGKADALNAGIAFSSKELVITLDADSILDPSSLTEMNRAFADSSVAAAGGMVNIAQGFKRQDRIFTPYFQLSNLIRCQVIQYLTTFYLYKATQSRLGSITVIAGAFGAFRRSVLLQADGYRKTVGEDMDITLRIQQLIGTVLKGKRIVFVPEAVCYTECPASLKSLFRQRIRWQKGFLDCFFSYKQQLFRKLNNRVSTYLLLDSLILGTLSAFPTLLIPILLIMTMSHLKLTFLMFLISIVLAVMQNVAVLIVSKRYGHTYTFKGYLSVLCFLPIEAIGFRLTNLLFVTTGSILYLFNKEGWNNSERVGSGFSGDTDNRQHSEPLDSRRIA